MQVGILAIQGGYEAHAKALSRLNTPFIYVRTVDDLKDCDELIIPGGESTTLLWFMRQNGLLDAVLDFAKKGNPIFGTCAGAILLAKTITHPEQESLGLIDMRIARNGYGRQINSRIAKGYSTITKKSCEMVFIRAPRILECASNVEILATYDDEPVCVQKGNCVAATFHPELSDDLSWHEYFLGLGI